MRVGIDIDGCIVRFNGYIKRLRSERRLPVKYPGTGVIKSIITDYHRTALPSNGAVEAIRRISEAGNEVFIISSRMRSQFEATELFFAENEIPFDGLFLGVKDKTRKCALLGIDVMIENNRRKIRGLRKAGIRTIRFRRNTEWTDMPSLVSGIL